MSLAEALRVSTCGAHHLMGCPRCVAEQERYAAWWASFPTTPPELGLDDLALDVRNSITMTGYCKCGRWFTAADWSDARMQLAGHSHCPYRGRITWETDGRLQLF